MTATWSEASGLILFLALIVALAVVHRLYLAVCHSRVLAAAARPLPGRTRDASWSIDLSDQPGEVLSRPPRPYRPTVPGLPQQRSRAS